MHSLEVIKWLNTPGVKHSVGHVEISTARPAARGDSRREKVLAAKKMEARSER